MKVVLMGDPGVGKTAIITQLIHGNTEPGLIKSSEWTMYALEVSSRPEKEDLMVTGISLSGTDPRREEVVGEGDAFLLVYSIADTDSFNNLKVVRDEILAAKNATIIPLMLVGNKLDLAESRQVSNADVSSLAQTWGVSFLEISAMNHDNVVQLFTQLVEESPPKVTSEAKKEAPKSGGCCTVL